MRKPLVYAGLAVGGLALADVLLAGRFADEPTGEGKAFARELGAEVLELVDEHGALIGGRPNLTPRQAEAWIGAWLERWATAHREDRARFRVLKYDWTRGMGGIGELEPAAGAWRIGELKHWQGRDTARSALGAAWDGMRAMHALARNATPVARDQPWSSAVVAADTVKRFAAELDAAAEFDGENLFEAGARRAVANFRRVPRLIGEGVGWVAETVIAPVLGGALAGTAAGVLQAVVPLALVAGAGYLVYREVK